MHISWDICVNILGCTSYWVRATLSVCYLDYLFPAESWTSTNFYHIGNHQILKIQLDVYFQGGKMEILISMHHSSQLCLFTRRLPIENQTRYCIVKHMLQRGIHMIAQDKYIRMYFHRIFRWLQNSCNLRLWVRTLLWH